MECFLLVQVERVRPGAAWIQGIWEARTMHSRVPVTTRFPCARSLVRKTYQKNQET